MPQLKINRTGNADIDRNLQAIVLAFAAIPDVVVPTYPTIQKSYTPVSTDRVVFIDASRGPITVTLPSLGLTAPISLRSTSPTTNPITIQVGSAAKINGSTAVITLSPLETIDFVWSPDTRTWWSL